MIKATMKNNEGKDIILLGLSKENVKFLQKGKPIHVKLSELGYTSDIVLIYGETEESITLELAPLMGLDTKVNLNKEQTVQ